MSRILPGMIEGGGQSYGGYFYGGKGGEVYRLVFFLDAVPLRKTGGDRDFFFAITHRNRARTVLGPLISGPMQGLCKVARAGKLREQRGKKDRPMWRTVSPNENRTV